MTDKSLLTNLSSLVLILLGWLLAESHLLNMGLYAFSGACTNWLAIHMLFEKVPFLYGSGVIPARFTEFKSAIKHLIMEQFFTPSNIQRFFQESTDTTINHIDLAPVLDHIDYDKIFQGLVDAIMASSLGSMVSMVGGPDLFLTIKEDFKQKMRAILGEISQEIDFTQVLAQQSSYFHPETVVAKVGQIVDQRLHELTPEMVKLIVQNLIKTHLGWLVVWGGVFGALIGLLVSVAV